jgi:hypothetical protein
MKKLFLFLLLLLPKFFFAQDVIVMRSGEEIQAKILEVNETEVKYKKFDYQDGPTFIVSKSKIFMIKYADGSKDVFSETPTENQASKKDSTYGSNILSTNFFPIFLGDISFAYEHIGKRGKLGLRIPFYIPVVAKTTNQLGGAFDFKFYLGKQRGAQYYLGPSIAAYVWNQNTFVGGIMFDNGVSFQPSRQFNITLDAGEGMGHYDAYHQPAFFNLFIWRAGLSFGFRF